MWVVMVVRGVGIIRCVYVFTAPPMLPPPLSLGDGMWQWLSLANQVKRGQSARVKERHRRRDSGTKEQTVRQIGLMPASWLLYCSCSSPQYPFTPTTHLHPLRNRAPSPTLVQRRRYELLQNKAAYPNRPRAWPPGQHPQTRVCPAG
jgi:hypothetical protein